MLLILTCIIHEFNHLSTSGLSKEKYRFYRKWEREEIGKCMKVSLISIS